MQDICPNCKRVTCDGCEDEDKRPQTRYSKKHQDKEQIDEYKRRIREILTKEG